MYPPHENSTGVFQELARKKDVTFGQLSYLIIRPNCSRGDHYHKRKREWFCCLHGRCELIIKDVRTNKTKNIILDESCKEFVKVNPFENHILKNLSDSHDCEILIIVNEEFNPEDPDTYRIEE
ncbi:hypothetical protein DRN73_06820 [Candidatus Pacearchaeota archaeon]|nr:MAG: hypothetical protein DRN73_06820 [Candidatus Pacearchaeota archaeon]